MKKRSVNLLIGVLVFGMLGNALPVQDVKPEAVVYAAEHNYPVSDAKKTLALDENQKDEQGVLYTLDEVNKTAMVGKNNASMNNTSEYKGANNQVCIIPEKVSMNGTEYTVTKVAPDAFAMNLNITTLVLADTVEEIGQYAFLNSKLEYLYIGTGVKQISEWAFHNSQYLREIKAAEGNTYFEDIEGVLYSEDMKILYYNPPLIKDSQMAVYRIPEGVERIVSYAFSFCKYRRVELSSTIRTIGKFGFDQSYIREIDLSNVTKIEDDAFRGCEFLRYIKLPASAYSVGSNSFDNLGSAEGLLLTKGLKVDTIGSIATFSDSPYLKCLAVEDGGTEIPADYFKGCTALETVIIPDTVTIIKSNAFSNCPNLKKIYIPSTVTLISSGAFSGNDTIIYGETGSKAESFANENGLTFIDAGGHQHATLSKTVLLDNDFMTMSADYCKECGYGDKVEIIKKECDEIHDATNGKYPFELSKTKEVKILNNGEDDQGLTYLGYTYGTTYSCNNGAIVKSMNDGTGKNHIVLPEVVVLDGEKCILSKIKNDAFRNSERIESLVISDTVTEVGSYALSTTSLRYLYIGANVKTISQDAFGSYHNVKGIWVSSANLNFYVKNNVLYDRKGNVIYDFSANVDNSTTEENTESTESTTEVTTEKDTSATEATTEKTTSVTESTTEAVTEKDTRVPTEEMTTEKETTTELPTEATVRQPSKVSEVFLSTDNGKRIIIKWKKSKNCTHYEIYRSEKKTKGYKLLKTISAKQTSYKDNKVKLYKKYYYKVRAVNKQKIGIKKGKYSKILSYTVTGLKTPTLKVKKKKTAAGLPYLELSISNANGKNLELVVKKEKGKYKKVRLKSSRISKGKIKLKIGYVPGKYKMWMKVRTYKTEKKKTYYSEFSTPVMIKK